MVYDDSDNMNMPAEAFNAGGQDGKDINATCELSDEDEDMLERSDFVADEDLTGMYCRCPSCGMEFDDVEHTPEVCRALTIESNKPRFYMMDLENYNEDFLKEIIRWQDKKIKLLEGRK